MTHSLFDLSGRAALVSGAARGVGRAIALALAEAGADLMLADLDETGAAATAADVGALGRRAVPVRCDVSDPEQIRPMFDRLDRELGRIDVLVNVAGGEIVLGPPEDLVLDEVRQSLEGLVVGRFCCCQEGGRRMLAAGRGSIINIGSLASLTAMGRGHTAYSTAMGGVAQMTRELSTEWASRGVRVNAILLAQILNPNLRERIERDPRMEEQWLRGLARGRLGEPDDVKGAAVFLASDAARWVTGILLPVDGGNLAMNAGASYPGGPGITG